MSTCDGAVIGQRECHEEHRERRERRRRIVGVGPQKFHNLLLHFLSAFWPIPERESFLATKVTGRRSQKNSKW